MDADLVREINMAISESSIGICRYVALEALKQQSRHNTNYSFIGGGMGFEELVDKNLLLKRNLNTSCDLDLIIKGFEDKQAPDIVNDIFDEHLDRLGDDVCYSMFGVLTTINTIILAAEAKYNCDLGDFKPTIEDWQNIDELFSKDAFFVASRFSHVSGVQVISLNVNYKGLTIQLMESSEYLYKIEDEYIFRDSYMNLLNKNYYSLLLNSLLEPNNAYPKKEKARIRLDILNAIHTTGEPDFYLMPPDIDIIDNKITPLRNDVDTLVLYLNSHTQKIAMNTDRWADACNCYSQNGDRLMNKYLLQNELFGIGNNDTMEVKNQSCNGMTPNEAIGKIISCMEYSNINNQNDLGFSVIRMTKPSLYAFKEIEKYVVDEVIHFASMVSTSYYPSETVMSFTTNTSPLVIFHIFLSKSCEKSFLFIESVSEYAHECEVLIRHGMRFVIKRKYYANVKFVGYVFVQKLVFELVPENDDVTLGYYNRYKSDLPQAIIPNQLQQPNQPNQLPNQPIQPQPIQQPNQLIQYNPLSNLHNIDEKQNDKDDRIENLLNYNKSGKSGKYLFYDDHSHYVLKVKGEPQIEKNYKAVERYQKDKNTKIIIETEKSADLEIISYMYFRGGGENNPLYKVVRYDYEYTDVIKPDFTTLLPYYLNNRSGYELKELINGYKYVDMGFCKVFPEYKLPYVKSSANQLKRKDLQNIEQEIIANWSSLDDEHKKQIKKDYYYISGIATKDLNIGIIASIANIVIGSVFGRSTEPENPPVIKGGMDSSSMTLISIIPIIFMVLIIVCLIVLIYTLNKEKPTKKYI